MVPWRIANNSTDNKTWTVINSFIDLSFFIDLILTFFLVYTDTEKGRIVENHREIAAHYIKTWFFVDLISILPIEVVINSIMKRQTAKLNSLARVSRIVKLYKIARFFRLSKLLKLAKAKKKSSSKSMENALKLREGVERFVLFGLFFSIFLHLVTCFWLMTT